ncbi:MAG: hypothetical protein ACTSP4_12170, partial [Candidatus Hodarchaeales archaeon]
MDSLVILRNLLEFTIFASWVDCVTHFNAPILGFLWEPEVLAGLDIHHMNSYDFNTRLAFLKKANNYNNLHRQDFERLFVSKGNPADFFFLLFKATCEDCKSKKKELAYLFRRALLWKTSDLLIDSEDQSLDMKKYHSDLNQPDRKFRVDDFSFERFFARMEKSASFLREKRLPVDSNGKENRTEIIKQFISPSIKISKNLNPVFGQDHLKRCSFCQSNPSSEALLQLPHFTLQIIWLQKIFPGIRSTLIKIRLAWTFLTDNYTHFSLKLLGEKSSNNSRFSYFDREIDLFSTEGISDIFNEIFTLIMRVLVYQERFSC